MCVFVLQVALIWTMLSVQVNRACVMSALRFLPSTDLSTDLLSSRLLLFTDPNPEPKQPVKPPKSGGGGESQCVALPSAAEQDLCNSKFFLALQFRTGSRDQFISIQDAKCVEPPPLLTRWGVSGRDFTRVTVCNFTFPES